MANEDKIVFPNGRRLSEFALSGATGSASGIAGIGTANYIMKWTDTTTAGDSIISQITGSNVGVNGFVTCGPVNDDVYRTYRADDDNLRWAIANNTSGVFQIIQEGNGWVNQGARITINRSGNIGIGTSTPISLFDLYGTSIFGYFGGINTGRTVEVGVNNVGYAMVNGRGGRGGSLTNVDLTLQASGGNVGIGIVEPTQKLDVNGSILGTNLQTSGNVILGNTTSCYIKNNAGAMEWHVASGKTINIVVG